MVNIGLIGAGRIAGHKLQAIKKFKLFRIVAEMLFQILLKLKITKLKILLIVMTIMKKC